MKSLAYWRHEIMVLIVLVVVIITLDRFHTRLFEWVERGHVDR